MSDSIQELKKRLEAIRDMGFVKTHRAGSTGIGKTLEDLLGIGCRPVLNNKKGFIKVRYFTDFGKFLKFTGMLIEGTDWDTMGIHPDNENGTFDIHRLQELKDFCANNPKYHILTETTDGDDFSDENTMPPVTITNEIRFVNRLNFYLGNGSKNPAELCHWTG